MRRLAQFVRLRASRVSRLASACICLACVSRLSRVCLASACVSRLRAFVSRASRVCLRLFTSRVPNACVCVLCVCVGRLVLRLSRICLASVSRLHLSRVCLTSVSRLRASRVSRLASVCLLVNACGNWLILCVGRHSKSLKGFCYRHTIAVHIDYVDYMNRPLIF